MRRIDWVAWTGITLAALLAAFLWWYQATAVGPKGLAPAYSMDTAREQTLEGYEEPAAVVAYVLPHIQAGDYDLAAPACAVAQGAE